jgi:hypothetical protein
VGWQERQQWRKGFRIEKTVSAKVDGSVARRSEAMPEQPPTAGGVRKRSIVGVLAKEMAIGATVGSTRRGGRVKKRLGKINLDEVPHRNPGRPNKYFSCVTHLFINLNCAFQPVMPHLAKFLMF